MTMRGPLVVYECALCHTYLENYMKATIHLGINHSASLINFNNNKKTDLKNTDKKEMDLIQMREFTEPNIVIERMAPERTGIKIREDSAVPKTIVKKRSRPKPRNLVGRTEIKLDTLKSGEMETLIKDLFDASEPSSSQKPDIPIIRKSTRKVKAIFHSSFGELDSEDEEIIRTGSFRNPKKTAVKDEDYSLSTDDEGSKTNEVDENCEAKKRKVNRKIVPQKPNHYYALGSICRICDPELPFPARKEYLEHMDKEHLKNNQYTCRHCQRGFLTLQLFSSHMTKKHPYDPNAVKHYHKYEPCKICGKSVRSHRMPAHLSYHEKATAEDPKRPHVCPVCNHRYGRRDKLRRHFVMHLSNNPFKCKFSECNGKAFTTADHLQRHVRLHTNREYFTCENCPAKFSTKTSLRYHVKEYHSKDSTKIYRERRTKVPNIKGIPDVDLQLPSTDVEAIKVKDEEGDNNDLRFEVESIHLADQVLTKEGQNDIHIKGERLSPQKHTRPSRSSSPSDIEDMDDGELEGSDDPKRSMDVDEIISTDPVFQKLQETHPDQARTLLRSMYKYQYSSYQGKKRIKCHLCIWSCSRSYMLQHHYKKCHSNAAVLPLSVVESTPDKPFALVLTCGSCGYQSKSSDDLSTHMANVHVRKYKFRCLHCSLRFETKSRKDMHEQRVHVNDKKFSCPKCDVKLATRSSLSRHLKEKHAPKVPKSNRQVYKCEYCDRSYIKKYSYALHLKLHTADRELSTCKICGQTCATTGSLKRHIGYVHLGVKNPFNERSRLKKLQAKMGEVPSDKVTPEVVEEGEVGGDDLTEILGF